MGYYRKFIPNFEEVAHPLKKLTRKKARFTWDTECEKDFQNLKQCLVQAPILVFPNKTDIFILDTDVSLYGIGGILSQLQDGEDKLITYASRPLHPAQQHFCTKKRVFVAVSNLYEALKTLPSRPEIRC